MSTQLNFRSPPPHRDKPKVMPVAFVASCRLNIHTYVWRKCLAMMALYRLEDRDIASESYVSQLGKVGKNIDATLVVACELIEMFNCCRGSWLV